jgi:DNA-binding transcriptional MerR regulator
MRSTKHDRLVGTPVGKTMTIGALSKRTGVPVKQLRRYEDLGFIYTVGRTAGNYRLFDETALWCVEAVTICRSLGLTLTEIGDLIDVYLTRPNHEFGPLLAQRLGAVRDRTRIKIEELQGRLQRIEAFEGKYGDMLRGEGTFHATDPRSTSSA